MIKFLAYFKKQLARAAYSIHPRFYLTLSYLHNRGHFPDFKNPKDLSEIVFSKLISGEINKFAPYADKIKVRDYINDWGFNEYLPKIYGVWDRFDDIDFTTFPQAFALKANNGCGSHYICKDKSKMSVEKARETLNYALTHRTWAIAETHYSKIKPRIYCEEFISDPDRSLPLDYKFMCCDGEIKCILVCSERDTGTKLSCYTTEWKQLNYIRSYERYKGRVKRPLELDKMIMIANTIASKFEYIRIDFYNIGHKVYIGELTFTPEGGIMKYFTNEAIKKLGHSN